MDKLMNVSAKTINMFLDHEGNLDLSCVLGVIAFCFFMFFSYHQFIELGKDFNPLSFGSGIAALLGAMGGHKFLANKGDYGV